MNRHVKRLVGTGLGDCVVFDTNQMIWPKLMVYSISVIQNADCLTPQQKRDILDYGLNRNPQINVADYEEAELKKCFVIRLARIP